MARMEIVGLHKQKYMGKKIKGHNCKFEYFDAELTKYFIYFVDDADKKYQLELYEKHTECPSGWTTGRYGIRKFRPVNDFDKFNLVPKSKAKISFDANAQDYKCHWFSFSEDGGDEYYPEGFVKVNMKLFVDVLQLSIEGLKKHCYNIDHKPVIKYILCFNDTKHQTKYELLLCENEKPLFSKVDNHGALTHKFIGDLVEDIHFDAIRGRYTCQYFSFSDKLWAINMEYFKPTSRGFDKNPVWVFRGKSNLGKSFLAHRVGMRIFETDACDQLPQSIEADIIVLGNKHKYTLDNIKERMDSNCEVVAVDFQLCDF